MTLVLTLHPDQALRTFSGPQPRPSRISMVMDRDTTSRDAKSFADGAYLRSHDRLSS